MDKIVNFLLIIVGTISLILGILGVFIPLFPTMPFLLLTSACYLKSSNKLYMMLIGNKYLGKHLVDYEKNRSISKRVKYITIIPLWISIGLSVLFVVSNFYIRILLVFIALAVSFHILSLKSSN
jgi:uncharacterized protein